MHTANRLLPVLPLALALLLLSPHSSAQVPTEVPPPVAGARPVTADRFQNHVMPFFSANLEFETPRR